jgi:phage tail-like protein
MRAAVPELASPDPFGRRLPAVYAADDLAQRLLAACDTVIAPVYATLDNLWAYFDPELAPPDFLEWLAGWVAADGGGDLSPDHRRAAVRQAADLHRRRGTAAGLSDEILADFGVRPEILESGATTWSSTNGGPLPGSAGPWLTVRLRVPDPSAVPVARLRALVDAARPAHVPYTIEVLPLAGSQPAPTRPEG